METEGTVLIACNCDYGCPCNFMPFLRTGHCEGGGPGIAGRPIRRHQPQRTDFFHSAELAQGDHDGNGEAAVLIRREANETSATHSRRLYPGPPVGRGHP